jgi:hypothetical protein
MKYLQFFRERIPNLPDPNEKGEAVAPCIFHADKNPSLGVNVESGKWKCYTPHCPGHAGGGWKKFDALLKGEVTTAGEVKVPPIDQATVDGFHHILLNSKDALDILQTKRGLTLETIKRFKLGWDSDRILIPITGPDGSIVNIRKYKYGAAKDKMIAWGPRYNRARLFPFENTKSDWVLLCEGETDCMLACQMGYPAVSATGGADTWLEEFNQQLKGKRVVICYDADPAGRKGATATALKLLPHAAEVRILTLPLAGSKEEKDITDYFKNLGHTKADFDKLIESAEKVEPLAEKRKPDDKEEEIHLSRVGEHRYVGKRIRSTVLIAGKDLAPYQVPQKVAYSCPAVGTEKMCDRCQLGLNNGQRLVQLAEWNNDLLQCVNVPVEKLNALMGRICGIPDRCPKYKYEVTEYANIESVKAIPEIDFTADESEYVIRNLFYLGHGIETNKTYHVTGVVMPDPKTQYATALIYDAVPSQDSIEKFEATDEMRNMLKMFQTEEDHGVS